MVAILNLWAGEQGQDLVEYSLLMAFVALVVAGMMFGGHDAIAGIWSRNTNNIQYGNAVAGGAEAPGF